MLPRADSFEAIRRVFRWEVPAAFNLSVACCTRHARRGDAPALIELRPDGSAHTHGFRDLERGASRLANLLAAEGFDRGDRLGILLGQRVETLLAHLACAKLGGIAVPLFQLFGPDALEYRLQNSAARVLVTDMAGAGKLAAIRDRLPALERIWCVDGAAAGTEPLAPAMARAADSREAVATAADDPALIIYTSGTTGPPKGALHAQRVLLGHLPGVQMPQEQFPQAGDRFWTPADWAWIGGLLDVLLPSLYFGVPVVAGPGGRFDPEAALALMARHEVRNVFMPPTALRLMASAGIEAHAAPVRLRSMGSGGEPLGDALVDWVRGTFDIGVNEFYGQTEANLLVSSMQSLLPRRSGAMGVPVPGHDVAVIDGEGRRLPAGEAGDIAVRRPDPVMFLRYWNNPEATAAKFRGDWLVTGDIGRADSDGWLTFVGRSDDLINNSGYRIGPAEIEECLCRHPAVALAAVIGVPDEIRGERIKAFLVTRPGIAAGDALADELRAHVRTRLAAHEVPRDIAFVDALPLTATGKVVRAELRRLERERLGR
ncbi:MAG TPA: AMP-binding protein [Geminicoccaceae bacterium]|nr:AMP-binding protein [Geminicoccus sp.]HMU48573.1 AMP-binding protein [Geminicoccaceae bacterium]